MRNAGPFFQQLLALESESEACIVEDRVFITGGCSGRGVQWMGVIFCNKTAYNTM